jgi:hypothetical protein
MQEINRSHSRKKIAITISVVVALIVAGGAAAYYLSRTSSQSKNDNVSTPNNTVDYGAATDEQKKAGEDAKKDFIERTEGESETPTQSSDSSSVSVSSVNQSGATLSIRTVISVQTAGSCKLTLSMSGQADIVRTTDVQDMGSYATCKGFDIDTSSMAKGLWKISLYFSGDAPGAVATDTVEVR